MEPFNEAAMEGVRSSVGIGWTSTVGLAVTGGGMGGGAVTGVVIGELIVVLEESSNELIELEKGTDNLGVGTGTNDGSKSGRID